MTNRARLGRQGLRWAALALVLGACALPASAAQGAGSSVHRQLLNHNRQGQPHDRSSRARASIIGGVSAEDGTFPWLAYVVDRHEGGYGACTGTVIAVNVVLTAGHCAEDTKTGMINEPSGYAIVTGNVEWTSASRQVSGVSRVLVYPGYLRGYGVGDAALLVLSTPTTAPAIGLATWPSDSTDLEAGKPAVMAGWGNTYHAQQSLTARLQWADTAMQKPGYCETNAPTFFPGDELCVINPPNYQTGACDGDSGGPLISLNPAGSGVVEIGLVSHGYGECSTTRPTVATRADLIASWAQSWIEALRPPPPAPPPGPTSTAPPVTTAARPWIPPNVPGLYVTPRSRQGRRVSVHVSGDGRHLVGVAIKTTLGCAHGYSYGVNGSWLSYRDSVPITNHVASTSLGTGADRYMRAGRIGMYVVFSSAGSLEGRLRIQIRSRNRRAGLCSGTLSFKARA